MQLLVHSFGCGSCSCGDPQADGMKLHLGQEASQECCFQAAQPLP